MAGIYIHIPFCHSKCAYCDFYSTPVLTHMQQVIDCLVDEYRMRAAELDGHTVNTIYLGGGTPSILDIDSLKRLIADLPLDDVEEFTIEANPEDVTPQRVNAWRNMGINRVSIGVQSLVDEELRLISRRHTADDAIRAVSTIREGGITNFSLDLIYGLPGQTLDSWRYSLGGLLDLKPNHFSAYILSYEPHTRLTAMLKAGKIEAADDDTIAEMYTALITEAANRGYEHYEISNFALPGWYARHNSSYWDSSPYLGLGPSAHSYDGRLRRINPSSIKDYVSAVTAGNLACEVEKETRAEIFNDILITRLRTLRGLNFREVPVGRRRKLLCDIYDYVKRGDIIIDGNNLRIPETSWLVSDAIIRELLV